LAIVCACTSPGRSEATALTDAVDRYRRADDRDREGMARVVAAVSCTEPRVCDAKTSCLAAIEPTNRAYALKAEVELRLDDIEKKRLDPDSPEAAALPGKLDEAKRLIEEARANMALCDRKLAELRLTFGG
jgi:hypothetical protein